MKKLSSNRSRPKFLRNAQLSSMSPGAGLLLWTLAWFGAAGVIAVHTASAGARQDPVVLLANGVGSATLGGVEVALVQMKLSGIETTVELSVSGRPKDGPTVNLLGRSTLILDDGSELRELSGDAAGRAVTLRFAGVPEGVAPSELHLRGVALSAKPAGLATAADRAEIGGFRITVPGLLANRQPTQRYAVNQAAGFGPGVIYVHEIVVAAGMTLVRGSVGGFTETQIQQLTLAEARIVTAVGSSFRLTGGGTDDTGAFQFVYPAEAVRASVLEVPFLTSPVPFKADGSLAAFVGTVARIDLAIP